MAEILKTDGTREPFDLGPEETQLRTMQAAVGGYIEAVTLRDSRVLVCNEEGKMLGLARNAAATTLLHEAGGSRSDYIVGDALLCAAGELT